MKTKLTELLGIKYPIFQGAMAWVSESTLAAAVSNAGGAGIIAAGGRTAEWVEQEIRKTKTLTDKPFGVNLVLMSPHVNEILEVICNEKVAFVTLGAGNPLPLIDKLHQSGIKVIPVVPNVKLAKRLEAAGADAIVIEGMEAGGHIGTLTTMALLTNVLPEVSLPVVAAGGIADGRGMAAALLMGASGVQIGTRFIISDECQVHPNVKQRLLEAVDTDSVVTGYSSAHAVRGLKNKFTAEYLAMEAKGEARENLDKLATGTNRLSAVDGDVENGMVQAGQSLNALKKIQPVQEIVEEVMTGTKIALGKANDLLGQF
ncbi:MAG: 2-nitropropane dioxygenase [Firmicutes bacterium]|nr:2-nitropropane dioxygenase [Bacillota bacterium]